MLWSSGYLKRLWITWFAVESRCDINVICFFCVAVYHAISDWWMLWSLYYQHKAQGTCQPWSFVPTQCKYSEYRLRLVQIRRRKAPKKNAIFLLRLKNNDNCIQQRTCTYLLSSVSVTVSKPKDMYKTMQILHYVPQNIKLSTTKLQRPQWIVCFHKFLYNTKQKLTDPTGRILKRNHLINIEQHFHISCYLENSCFTNTSFIKFEPYL